MLATGPGLGVSTRCKNLFPIAETPARSGTPLVSAPLAAPKPMFCTHNTCLEDFLFYFLEPGPPRAGAILSEQRRPMFTRHDDVPCEVERLLPLFFLARADCPRSIFSNRQIVG